MAVEFDIVVVGGGMAGLMAAARAEAGGLSAVLIDGGVPGTPGELGGFAPFSGAKFSLFPAGTGLSAIVGGNECLIDRYRQLCAEFVGLGFPEFSLTDVEIAGHEVAFERDLAYRNYHSVLLSPRRMDDLLKALATRLLETQILRETVTRLAIDEGDGFKVSLSGGREIWGRRLIVAAGRLGAELLEKAGIPQTAGKGIDVGIRLGFDSCRPLAGLRQLGPDAKFMAHGVRTFCLNSPGRIFHYPGLGFSLPGGIVAESDGTESNVGILLRLEDRDRELQRLRSLAQSFQHPPFRLKGNGLDLGWTEDARQILGQTVIDQIEAFVKSLSASGLVALPTRYAVHYPLFDWHWPVFSQPGRLATGIPGVFAAGDTSGHARGLLQAALMGALAVEEALN
ncbi:Ferredoxin--NADP reductase [Sphingobium sp. S6]|nr:Ferredoxin--NADP reductase [Sphingobium sp. S6]CAD7338707.1 Ferredoxin--NADP reductase [Sphingobium sp. S8]